MTCLACCARLVASAWPSAHQVEAMLAAIGRFRDAPSRAAVLAEARRMLDGRL
ncbi:MAG: hypothetical protein N2690_01705 [Rhodocyclaceae bacterium]|nr:hypothetical protein [Rhodocyclaceae bacterium]